MLSILLVAAGSIIGNVVAEDEFKSFEASASPPSTLSKA
jgi:hypothetical protein